MSALHVADDVRELGIPVTAFVVEGIDHAQKAAGAAELSAAERAVAAGLTDAVIDDDPLLAGYRQLHERVGSGSRHVAAPEALRRILLSRGRVPRISPVVDLYNAVSLTTRLAIGAHDAARVDGDVSLRRLRGDERFVPLGAREQKGVRAGEYAYVDGGSNVLCRLEVQQGDATKITRATNRAFLIVQGNAAFSEGEVETGAARLARLIERVCGARVILGDHAQRS
jgi:DNA/RNA-binding domain of Phe-tRNA-synthetase-like protein